jgi:hypothetical protein
MANLSMSLKRIGTNGACRHYIPRDGNGVFKSPKDLNFHPAHIGVEAGDLTAEALGFGREGRKVNDWLARWLPSQTEVNVGAGIGSANGRREPVVDLPGVSLKIRAVPAKGKGKRSGVLTTLRNDSARGIFGDLAALHARGRDVAVVTLLLDREDTGAYILREDEVRYSVSYPFREFAATGWDASLDRARKREPEDEGDDPAAAGKKSKPVGRPAAGTKLPDTWLTHKVTTCIGGSWVFNGSHPRTNVPTEWRVGTYEQVRAVIAGLMYL